MNAAIILILAIIWLFIGYRFYSRFIEKRIKINDKKKTPAVTKKDDVDYSPAKKEFLWGHHFASIAGAGPIIGPILAVNYFGWVPVIFWILIGVVFIGAMHDYVSLMASVRNKAKGVAEIVKKYLNSKSGWIFCSIVRGKYCRKAGFNYSFNCNHFHCNFLGVWNKKI